MFDYEWGKLDAKNYEEFRKEDILSVDLPYQDESFLMGRADDIDTYFLSRPFGCTDFENEGWVFDPYSEASFIRCRQNYDMDWFWEGFGNMPSVKSKEYIKGFFEHREVAKELPASLDCVEAL